MEGKIMAGKFEIVAFETDSGETVYVETFADNEQPRGLTEADQVEVVEEVKWRGMEDKPKKPKKTIEKALGLISSVANGVLSAVNKMEEKPSEVSATFNVALSNTLDLKIVTLTGESNLEIKITWNN